MQEHTCRIPPPLLVVLLVSSGDGAAGTPLVIEDVAFARRGHDGPVDAPCLPTPRPSQMPSLAGLLWWLGVFFFPLPQRSPVKPDVPDVKLPLPSRARHEVRVHRMRRDAGAAHPGR